MEKKDLKKLVNLVRGGIGSSPSFRMEEERSTPLDDFHCWANNKECLGAFLIGDKHTNAKYWFLFIDWPTEYINYYLVFYPEKKGGGPILEIREIDNDEAGNACLKWTYIPTKEDGKNPARKEVFKQLAGDTKQYIPIPRQKQELDDFLRACFQLLQNREIANNLGESSPGNNIQEEKTKIMKHPLNQILYGPPGTGKTWNTVNYAVAIIDGKSENKNREDIKQRFDELKRDGRRDGQIEMVTFHQNYTYEDFIEGIRPILSGEQEDQRDIKYELSAGIFKRIAQQAEKNQAEKKNYVLIIDEINRGNIAKIFGELITLIEPSKRLGEKDAATATLPYSRESFRIPNNLYIIGTMNTADRSIALLDTALRRRFDFVEMMPDPKHSGISKDIQGVNCQELLEKINERIRILHDRDHQVGHTYFLDVKDLASLAKRFKNRIIPLLQEYFYDDWEKIDLVLNKNGFIQESGVNEGLFKTSEFVDTERKIYELLPANDDKWQDPDSYISIYKTQNQSSQERQENQDA